MGKYIFNNLEIFCQAFYKCWRILPFKEIHLQTRFLPMLLFGFVFWRVLDPILGYVVHVWFWIFF
jgi:hypothetical protein